MGDLSDWGAGANILKGLIGLGVLTLPYATKLVGWLPSVVGMALIALLSLESIWFAVASRVALERTETEEEATPLQKPSDPSAGLSGFDTTVKRTLGTCGLYVFRLSVALSQLTTVVAYLDVLAASAESYMENDHRLRTLALLGVVVCLLSFVKTLSGVSILSYAGLSTYLLIFSVLFTRFVGAASAGGLGEGTVVVRHENTDYATWFGVSAFAFGGLPVSLVVYDDMRDPSQFGKVAAIAYGLCWLFYSGFAVLGFWCYGEGTQEVIYFNFEPQSAPRHASLLMVCLVLFVSYVLQMMPLYRCVEDLLNQYINYRIVRTVLVVFTLILAHFMPSSTTAMTLGGTFSACISAFIIPPVVYLTVFPNPGWLGHVLSATLIIVGTAGAVLGLWQWLDGS